MRCGVNKLEKENKTKTLQEFGTLGGFNKSINILLHKTYRIL